MLGILFRNYEFIIIPFQISFLNVAISIIINVISIDCSMCVPTYLLLEFERMIRIS